MSKPTIEALREKYERAAIESRQRGDQPWCLPSTVGFIYDAGLKAVFEAGRKAHAEAIHEALVRTVTERSEAVAERDAARAEAAELGRRLADAEDCRYELKEALYREEQRHYVTMRWARAWKAAAKRWRVEAKRLRAAWAEAEPLVGRIGSNWAEDPRGDADRACAIMREALRGGAP